MDTAGILKKVRMFLADSRGVIWSDDELISRIEQALEQYSFDSGLFIGKFNIAPDATGKYSCPDDHLGFLIAWNENGLEIKETTAGELFKKQNLPGKRQGSIEYIYKDSSSLNEFDIYPHVEQNTQFYILLDDRAKPWGEIADGNYGVTDNGEWGISDSIKEFDFAGDCIYTRLAGIDEVKDYMALVYYTLYLAYSSDTEFANSNLAAIYLEQYKGRVNAAGNINLSNVGKKVNPAFY